MLYWKLSVCPASAVARSKECILVGLIFLFLVALSPAWNRPAWGQTTGGVTGGLGGPSILSRGGTPVGRSGGRPIRFRGFLSAAAFYSDGLTPPATDVRGNDIKQESYGYNFGYGVYGTRPGRRSEISLSYTGSYHVSTVNSRYSGLNQSLSLNYGHQVSRRVQFFAGTRGSAQNTSLANFSTPLVTDIAPEQSPTQFELFDNQYYTLSGIAGLAYQKSARWTFTFAGGAATTQRHSTALASGTGYFSNADATYALSRRTRVGATFGYNKILYRRSFGESDVMSLGGHWSRVLSPRWNAALGAGIYRSESTRLRRVAVDPLVAALLGQRTTLEVFHGINLGLQASAMLQGHYNRSSISFVLARGVGAGNSLLLTAQRDIASTSYSYAATRNLSFTASASYAKARALLISYQDLGSYETYGGGVGMSYRLFGPVHFTSSGHVRHYNQRGTSIVRDRYYVRIGLTFSPGELPLLFW